jgi:hypothetical protein
MFMSKLTLAAIAALTIAVPAMAQDYGYDGRYDDFYDYPEDERVFDEDYRYPGDRPPAGHQVARDYLRGEYYAYQGTPPRDPRVGEQEGWREGVVRTPPRWYWNRCGCSQAYYYGRWHKRPQLYDYSAYDYSYRHRLDRRTAYEYRWPRRNW